MLIPTNNSHIASVYKASADNATACPQTNRSSAYCSQENLTIYENTFSAAQAKFKKIDPCTVEAKNMKFKEFAYKNDTIKTTILSHCNKIWLKIKSATLNFIVPLEGKIKFKDIINSTAKIQARKEKIIDKIDTTINFQNDTVALVYPILNKSDFGKDDLQIRVAQYPLNSSATIPKPIDLYPKQQTTIFCEHDNSYFKKSESKIADVNRIVYDRGNTFISYGIKKKDGNDKIKEHFMVAVNDLKKCAVFYDGEEKINFLNDTTQAAIIPDCTQGKTKSLISIQLEKNKDGDSLQLCNSRVKKNGEVKPCCYGQGFYKEFNKGLLSSICSGDGQVAEASKFYIIRKKELRAANLGKIGEHAVILYANQSNTMYSYIVNAKSKVSLNEKYLIDGSQKLFQIEDANVTQVHVGQVPGVHNQLYACCLDTSDTLHCLHGNITFKGFHPVEDYSQITKIYNSTVIEWHKPPLAIYNVTSEVFSNNTIDSLYQNAFSTTTSAPITTVTTPTTNATTIEMQVSESTTTQLPTTTETTTHTTTELPSTTTQKTTTQTVETSAPTTHTTTELPSTTTQKITTQTVKTSVPTTHTTTELPSTTTQKITTQTVKTSVPTTHTTTHDPTTIDVKTLETTNPPTTIALNVTNDTASLISHEQLTTSQPLTQNPVKKSNTITIAVSSLCTVLLPLLSYILYRRHKNKTIMINGRDRSYIDSFVICCIGCIRTLCARCNSQVDLTSHSSLSHDNPVYNFQPDIDDISDGDVIFDLQDCGGNSHFPDGHANTQVDLSHKNPVCNPGEMCEIAL